jgi:hypothetical protein
MEIDHWEDHGLGGFSILNLTFKEIRWDGWNWIHLAQDKDMWMALVNTVINLRVP